MARLILKCRYLKVGSAKHSENLIKYIATRDGVEKLDDSWKSRPVTKAQKELIEELVSDFPDTVNSFEYQDYLKTPTAGAASELITRTLEDNADLIGKRENYVGYIAKRPRAERIGSHGLFTDSNVPINLTEIAKEVANHEGNVWTNILSLRREDAVRLGYDRGSAWRDLLRGQAETMATAMKIPLTDLRWYAAFHNEGHHPHVHIVAYSVGKEPYLSEQGILKMKSAFAREIFKQDLIQVYERQTEHRNALAQESRSILSEITEQINRSSYENETVELLMRKLADRLSRTKGKKVYGYLPQTTRNLVNGIVDELEKDSRIALLYDLWYEQRKEIVRTYTDAVSKRVPLSQNKEFKSVRNAVIQEAISLYENKMTWEDRQPDSDEGKDEQDSYYRAKIYLDRNAEQYDPVEAVRLLQETAEQGNRYAQYQLGKMYLYGQEVERDYSMGVRLLTKAAEQGDPYARYLLEHDQPGENGAPVGLAALRLMARLLQIFRDQLCREENSRRHTEKKSRQKMVEKMQLHGQKMG